MRDVETKFSPPEVANQILEAPRWAWFPWWFSQFVDLPPTPSHLHALVENLRKLLLTRSCALPFSAGCTKSGHGLVDGLHSIAGQGDRGGDFWL